MTEKQLFDAFDRQRFERNARLQRVIDAAHRRMNDRELDDDELDAVSAAGAPEARKKRGELHK